MPMLLHIYDHTINDTHASTARLDVALDYYTRQLYA